MRLAQAVPEHDQWGVDVHRIVCIALAEWRHNEPQFAGEGRVSRLPETQVPRPMIRDALADATR